MAESESDLETDAFESALETLAVRHCGDESSPQSRTYCAEFCKLVEEYTGRWQVPLPQLKVLRTALCSFTKAVAAFPDDCQHISYALSSLALSFFELMLFFSKEEFGEEPLKYILDSFQECHLRLLRHKNVYLQRVKHTIKVGGPWENPVLQSILREAAIPQTEVEEYLSSEEPVFLELRLRYLQACDRVQEATTLAKSCMENPVTGKHLYFHQAYLTCLYKASLHENLQKKMEEIDGHDAVEIICNTESVEKDELLLSLCKAFLTQQLRNGDMYCIWDLVFIWSRLYIRAHHSRQGFLAECHQLSSSAANIRAIFPFIKVVTSELGGEGVLFCLELCTRALQLCDLQVDLATRSLVCKTIAFMLPCDLEVCRACALLVFCQERSLEAYRTVCLLYMHPDQEPHPHNHPVPTNVRFHILQELKRRLCFDPEFWNLLTLRTHCLELISDKAMKAAVLNEMEEETECHVELIPNKDSNDSCTLNLNSLQPCTDPAPEVQGPKEEETENGEIGKQAELSHNTPVTRKTWRRKRRIKRPQYWSEEEFDFGDDPEIKFNVKSSCADNDPEYSLKRDHMVLEKTVTLKLPPKREREYLSRCVKNQILKRKGRKKRWLQGLPKLEQMQVVKEAQIKIKGKKRGRKPLQKLELSYPENEVYLQEDTKFEMCDTDDREKDESHKECVLKQRNELNEIKIEQLNGFEKHDETVFDNSLCKHTNEEPKTEAGSDPAEVSHVPQPVGPAAEADPKLDGTAFEFFDRPMELFHNYALKSEESGADGVEPLDSTATKSQNDDTVQELAPFLEMEKSTQGKGKLTWKDRMHRTQQYSHLVHHCSLCLKGFKGLNVMRHALSHLRRKKLRCIFCGKRFKQLNFAKRHVLEHIDELIKSKPSSMESNADGTPVVNGTEEELQNDTNQEKNQPSAASDEQKPKPDSVKTKGSNLCRESRIIRNLRILIRKSFLLHKKKKLDDHLSEEPDFRDEQVVIKDNFVIVKDGTGVEEEKGGEHKELQDGVNGNRVDIMYYLCPSESCDKVFMRIGATLTKHAINFHIKEEKVLEKTFVWAKHKCIFCLRQMQSLQHYKDHMKLHDTTLRHFCYHLECNQRFMTHQELKDHVKIHQPFRARCPYTDCEQVFSGLQALYDHEWRHYVPAPQREELEVGVSRQQQSTEAPWKQRVKIEEIWLQSEKGQKESPKAHHFEPSALKELIEMDKSEAHPQATAFLDSGQNMSKLHTSVETTVNSDVSDINRTLVNGYEDGNKDEVSERETSALCIVPVALHKTSEMMALFNDEPLNVKNPEEMSTIAEGFQVKLGEPHIAEHKTFKPEDPAYATFIKAPFIRPPPSTYLDESLLCMRKRRSTEETPQKKYITWNSKKKKEPEPNQLQQRGAGVPQVKTRHRCNKCLSSFSSPEEMEQHQNLNTCSALFGFDSDDES
ncbi:zinc finger protein 654-like [Lampris incognitus]|uniref:zinc finger protein 654-like n=1 Tax=Lampris incognitus TaxID=2546036 RepID=UPI0024B604A0|nr:zinc finger protein 654-like [Lampris incognitus]